MRILFDQAEHAMRNKGNNALLQAAMDRVSRFWPEAELDVVTVAPNLLRMYFPFAHPVSPIDLQLIRSRTDRLHTVVPRAAWRLLLELREDIWHRWPGLASGQMRAAIRSWLPSVGYRQDEIETDTDGEATSITENDSEDIPLLEAVSRYALVVATGGGYVCDHDKALLLSLFDRLEAAMAHGVPTVMVGQGIGPISDSAVRLRAMEILPKIDLICYRNRRLGRPLLDFLGVSPERIVLTGDDAIEMAFQARSDSLGTGIGVSLRVSSYTQVGKQHIETVRSVLHRAASKRGAALIAVPISSAHHESDITYIKQLLAGYDDISVGWQKLDTPSDAIRKAGLCRVVVTGTYHGAIFALAQGIPVVGVAKSTEYFDKLSELTDEFGPGCQTIRLDDEKFPDELMSAIDRAWSSAEESRPALLAAASRQIEWQRAAYQRIHELVTKRSQENQVASGSTPDTLSA